MLDSKSSNTNSTTNPFQRFWRMIWRWSLRGLLIVLALFSFLYFIIQVPSIQNWTSQQITQYLQEKGQTKLQLDYVKVGWFNQLILENVFIEDTNCDTLLASEVIRVNLNTNPIVLLTRGLVVDEVELKGTKFYLRQAQGEYDTNLDKLVEVLFPPDPDKEEEPPTKSNFEMDIRDIYLEDVLFFKEDWEIGDVQTFYVKKGSLRIDELNLKQKRLLVKKIILLDPAIRIDKHPPVPVQLPDAQMVHNIDSLQMDTDSLEWYIAVKKLDLVDGYFEFHNYNVSPAKREPLDEIDYQHMKVFDIQIDLRDFAYSDYIFAGKIDNFIFREETGFTVEKFRAKQAYVSPRRMELNGLELVTPYSTLGDTLVFKYRSFNDYKEFNDKILMSGHFNNSKIAIKDIMTFAPALKENRFFNSNRDEVLEIEGRVSGRVNNLRGRDLTIRLGKGSKMVGRFSSRNLAVRNEEYLNLVLDDLQTNMRTLRALIPNFNLPSNFDRLGGLRFNGRFDGFFVDFVADGKLQTDIGRAEMDMQMNLVQGRQKARYRGNLMLQNFDLGTWTGNKDLGEISFRSKVVEGVGLTTDVLNAELQANVESFTFRDYQYQNANLNGTLNRSKFDGKFDISDDNIDFDFSGSIDFTDSIPEFDFDAAIRRLDLLKLNLSKTDLVLSGVIDLNLKDQKLSTIQGTANVDDFILVHNRKDRYEIDSIAMQSTFNAKGEKEFTVRSDVIEADITGDFDVEEIPNTLLAYFKSKYPELFKRTGLKVKDKEVVPNNFVYNINLKDSKGLNLLLDEKLGRIEKMVVKGEYESSNDILVLDLDLPSISYDNVTLGGSFINIDGDSDGASVDLGVDSTQIGSNTTLSQLLFSGTIYKDTVEFFLNYESEVTYFDKLSLEGRVIPVDSLDVELTFNPTNLILLEQPWVIDPDNSIILGKKSIHIEDFSLTNPKKEGQKIYLESVDDKEVTLFLRNFEFDVINNYWVYDPLDFAGTFDSEVKVRDVFEMEGISLNLKSSQLLINEDDWGNCRINVYASDLKNPIEGTVEIGKTTPNLFVTGLYNPPAYQATDDKIENQPNYFLMNCFLNDVTLGIAEYFIGNNISNTEGYIDGKLNFYGLPGDPQVSGSVDVSKGQTTIDYLNTTYRFTQSKVKVDNRIFDATGTILLDKNGQEAIVTGGIEHDQLKNFRLAVDLNADQFLALDTKKGDNPNFYGQAVGTGFVEFYGTFAQPNIRINAEVGDKTSLIIPVSSTRDASELKFITFVDKHNPNKEDEEPEVNQAELTGLDLEMNLVVNEEASIEIVFDEQAGDAIKGAGRGNLRLLVPRGFDLQLYGDFTIDRGSYLFTFYNFVNKNFTVNRGGTIEWSGNPFDAEINIDAVYSDLNTSVANFIAEYLQSSPNEDLRAEAANSTDVVLNMNLSGQLLKPTINFDIAFPNLSGQLKSFADSKLRILQQDQNELNRQVFGLIVAGQFIPDRFQFQGSDVIYNTVSEFVSNQLSLLVTELFSDLLENENAFSAIDFDVAYSQYQSIDFNAGESDGFNRGDEFEVRLKIQDLFSDRLSLQVGSNILDGNFSATPEASGTFVGNDVVLEYILNSDRSLKLRVYQKLQPAAGGGRRLQVGTGLSFRKEFDSFNDFIKDIKQSINKVF